MPPSGDRRVRARRDGRESAALLAGMWLTTVPAYVAPPVVALLCAVVAIAVGIVFLVQERSPRPPAMGAFVLAGVGLLWALVQLSALH